MPYIGNTPSVQSFTPAIDYFSGNGVTVTFTLSRPVVSVAQMIVAIDNVIQNPSSAFTVSGSSITFTSAPLSGTNNIWVEYTSLITTYNAISQDPSVIGDITASGGYLAVGDFGNSYIDGTIVDYVTGNARITTGPADGLTIYNGGTSARTALAAWDTSGNLTNTGGGTFNGVTVLGGTTIPDSSRVTVNGAKVYSAGIPQQQLNIYDSTALAAGTGGAVSFSANYVGSSPTTMASIEGVRENSTSGNYAGNLIFKTRVNGGANTEYMRINSSGYVTTPSQPAFRVRFNGTSSFTVGSPILFDTVDLNVGNCYNTSTGRFTAPVAGRYMFYAQLLGNNSAQRGYFFISKNGDSSTELSGTVEFYNSVNGLAILDLAAGEYVMCYPQVSVWYGSASNQDFFTGYLLG